MYCTAVPTVPCVVLALIARGYGTSGDVTYSSVETDANSTSPFFQLSTSGTTLTGGAGVSPQSAQAYTYTLAYDASGNITTSTDPYNGMWFYTYDPLNRLVGTKYYAYQGSPVNTPQGPAIFQGWSYDSFGNRLFEADLIQGNNPTACPTTLSTSNDTHRAVYDANNHITQTDIVPNGFSYDVAGNVTADATNNYVYDAEGRVCAVWNHLSGSMTQYVYDAEGRRVDRGTLASWPSSGQTCSVPLSANGFGLTSNYLQSMNGSEDLEVFPNTGAWRLNVFAQDGLLATYNFSNSGSTPLSLSFALNDWLGTKRAAVNQSGQLVNWWASDPFGNYLTANNSSADPSEEHFTGKERDTESGNDYFGARYYASTMGRWISPDPSVLDYADLANPQTLNLYSYVLNNPLSFTDPTGLYCYWDDGSSDDDPKDGGAPKKDCLSQGGNWTDQSNPCNGADNCVTATQNNPKPMDLIDFFGYLYQWKAGTLPNNIVYLQNSGWTNNLRQSPGVKAGVKKYASGGCQNSSQLGTHGPFTGVTTNLAQAEMGNFDLSSSTSGNAVTFTVTNTSGQASYSGANDTGGKGVLPLNIDRTKDNPNGPNGPGHNVNQTFVWSQPNPCASGASK